MGITTTVVLMVVRVLGVVQLVLGVLFWSGNAGDFVQLHMFSGILLVVGLWVMAGLTAGARVGAGVALAAVVWGLLVVALGMTQTRILPGSLHWVIQMLHLLFGLGALAQAENLARRIKGRRLATTGGALALGGD